MVRVEEDISVVESTFQCMSCVKAELGRDLEGGNVARGLLFDLFILHENKARIAYLRRCRYRAVGKELVTT
jgi:hypothetical protein